MKNLKVFLVILIVVLVSTSIYSQTFYRSVVDDDDYVYVTRNEQLLVLKREQSNDLQLVNILPFFTNFPYHNYNSSIIIDNYLISTSLDSIILYSIEDRDSPVELHRIYSENTHMIEKFGNYCFVYVNNPTAPLYKIENDSLKLVSQFPFNLGPAGPIIGYSHRIALSFPYLYKNVAPDTISIYNYDENINQFMNVSKVKTGNELSGLVANSNWVFTLEWETQMGDPILLFKRYGILTDSLEYLNLTHYSGGIPVTEGWKINETFGFWYCQLYQANTGNPTSNYNVNISCSFLGTNPHPYYFNNDVYRIGEDNFWYQYELSGLNLTLKQFIFPSHPSIPQPLYPVQDQQVNPDTVNFLFSSSSPDVNEYRIHIFTDSVTNTIIDTIITDTTFTAYNFEADKRYFWRVKSKNVIGWSNYSAEESFITTTTDVEDNFHNNLEFSLHQNYPNPFNPATIIKYTVASRQLATLKVYDVLGREVATLINEEKPPGVYEVNFDASDLSSGIYFYKLSAGKFVETKKMILLQ